MHSSLVLLVTWPRLPFKMNQVLYENVMRPSSVQIFTEVSLNDLSFMSLYLNKHL